MFSVNDTVFYSNVGACVIQDITEMRFGRTREKYYILKPLYQSTSVIYVPFQNASLVSRMRPMLTREEVNSLISVMPELEYVWIDDVQERKAYFDERIHSNDCRSLIQMIKCLYTHKRERISEGKNLHVSDENYLREAERLLYDEFAGALDITPGQVTDFIQTQLAAET